ncbi:MAG: hypothetical protein EON59_06385 [Alphaproteobacteria bacterium]|nr:MAG: hypothetical protein EON59_06385 [Alphaproteobacteria bacterium]
MSRCSIRSVATALPGCGALAKSMTGRPSCSPGTFSTASTKSTAARTCCMKNASPSPPGRCPRTSGGACSSGSISMPSPRAGASRAARGVRDEPDPEGSSQTAGQDPADVGKGGGGKTSTAIQLALAALRAGLRVAIIDLDPQKCTYAWWRIRNRNDVPVSSMTTTEAIAFINSGRAGGLDLLIIDCGKDPGAHLGELADHCDMALLPMRPCFLDIAVTRDWVQWLARHKTRHAVIINAAPPRRRLLGQPEDVIPPRVQESPLVRETRDALRDEQFRVWKGQLSYLHGMMYAVGRGRGFIELRPEGPAAREIQWLLRDIARELGIPGEVA